MLSTDLKSLVKDFAHVNTDIVRAAQDLSENIDDQVHDLELSLLDQTLSNDQFRSDAYIAKKATDKMADIWSQVQRTAHTSGSFPGVDLAGIFIESMKPSFEQKGDAMPAGQLYGTRTKYIHSVGVVGKVSFKSTGDHPYTGSFKGATQGIVRFSSAVQPSSSQALAPGMGLKFLRDGVDSSNLVAMYSVEGQPGNWNFFANNFTNHIGEATGAATKALSAKFASATKYITEVGLKDMGAIDEQGQQESSPTYPFALRFAPSADVKDLIPKDLPGSDYLAYVKQLESVPADLVLYDVYAFDKPAEEQGTEKLIGHLTLDSELVATKWGDEDLFFRHGYEDGDLADHADWDKYTPHYGCPFGFSK